MHLRSRTFLPIIFSTLLLAVYLIFVWIPPVIEEQKYLHEQTVRAEMTALGEILFGPLQINDTERIYGIMDRTRRRHGEWQRLELYDPRGGLIYPADGAAAGKETGLQEFRHSIRYLGEELGTVVVYMDMAGVLVRKVEALRSRLFWGMVMALTIYLLLAYIFLEGLIRRPVAQLAEAARRLAQGDYDPELPSDASGEIGQLAGAFETMVQAVRASRAKLEDQQEALKKSSARLRHLIVSSPSAIYCSVPSGDFRITYVSDNIRHVLGYSPEEMLADPDFWHDHIHPDDRPQVFSELPKLFSRDKHTQDYRFLHKDGSYRWLHDQLRVVRDDRGEAIEIVGSLTDITANKEAEQQLIEYRDRLQDMVAEQTRDLVVARDRALAAERAMSAFLANMSHELRTPLHGILSYAGFGLKKIDRVSRDKLVQYFSEIQDSGERLLGLVNDLLDLSKLRAGKMVYEYVEADLGTVIHGVVNEFAARLEERRITVTVNAPPGPAVIVFDKVKIAQVVRNLLSNAMRFSPDGSGIGIDMKRGAGGGLRVEVSDQGMGIPEGELELIFDAFSQSSKTRTSAGGTGLGLPICKEIVEQGHHGRIWAANRPEGGARFTFVIPADIAVSVPEESTAGRGRRRASA